MECLFFLWWNFALYLACYDGTCYLDETLQCNMYMDGTMCMDGTWWNLLMYECMELMCWIYVIWMPVKYIYICHIYLLWKLLDLIKNRKKSQYAGSLPSATDGNGLFAVCRGRQRSHVAANCASWELTHLVSLPTVADGKEYTILPSAADGKGLPCSDV